MTSAQPYTSNQRYDAMGRVTGTISASSADYNADLGSAFTVHRTLETSYDAMGRKVREQLREGAASTIRTVTQSSYDVMGRVTCTAVRMNPAVLST